MLYPLQLVPQSGLLVSQFGLLLCSLPVQGNSFACMSSEDLPKKIMVEILLADSPSGLLKTWSTLVSSRCYHSLSSNRKNKGSFKAAAKKSVLVTQYVKMTDTCTNLPISSLPAHLGRPSMLWSCCQLDRSLHGLSNLRIRLLVGLELDASRFRYCNRDASCELCNTEEESPSHFLVSCRMPQPASVFTSPTTQGHYMTPSTIFCKALSG